MARAILQIYGYWVLVGALAVFVLVTLFLGLGRLLDRKIARLERDGLKPSLPKAVAVESVVQGEEHGSSDSGP